MYILVSELYCHQPSDRSYHMRSSHFICHIHSDDSNLVVFGLTIVGIMANASGSGVSLLATLSNEILHKICFFIQRPDLRYRWTLADRKLEYLGSLSLTCRALHALCLPIMFRTVAIKHDWNRASMRLEEMLHCPMLALYARLTSFGLARRHS